MTSLLLTLWCSASSQSRKAKTADMDGYTGKHKPRKILSPLLLSQIFFFSRTMHMTNTCSHLNLPVLRQPLKEKTLTPTTSGNRNPVLRFPLSESLPFLGWVVRPCCLNRVEDSLCKSCQDDLCVVLSEQREAMMEMLAGVLSFPVTSHDYRDLEPETHWTLARRV